MKLPAILGGFDQKPIKRLRGSNFSQKALNAYFTSAPAGIETLDSEEVRVEKLQRSEALLAGAERVGHIGCWEHDLVSGQDVWSANLCRMLCVNPTKTKLSEELFWELLHPDDREAVRTVIEGAMKFAHEYEYKSRFILPGGRERTFYTWGKPVLGPDNQVIKRMGVTQDISVRVEAERSLMESEERYRDLVESGHDLICTHDLSGRVLSMNELPARLLGYRPEELIGRCIPDQLPGGGARIQFEEYIERIKQDGFANGLMALMTKSGERRVWEYQNTLRTEGVSAPLVRGMAHDVTEKIKAQTELRESTARLQALVNSIDQIAFEFDADGTFLDIWTTDESLLFLPREKLLGRRISDVVRNDLASVYDVIFKRVLESGKGEDLEYSLRVMGRKRWFLGRATPIVAPDGTYKSICMLARDITDRKQAEKSLSLFRALIDRSNDAIEVIDPDTLRFLDVNQKACSDVGYTREEILLMSVYDIDPTMDAANRARVIEALKQSGPLVRESVHRRKDGSTFPVEININLVQLDKTYVVTVARDIADRKKAEDALHQKDAMIRGLFHIAQTLTKTLELDAILEHLNYEAMMLIGTEGSSAGILSAKEFTCDSFFDRSGPKKEGITWTPDAGLLGWVLMNKRTYLTNDAAHDPLIPPEMHNPLGLRSVLCVPVLGSQEEVIAFFALHNKCGGDFRPSDVETVEGISKVASIAIQNALAYQRTSRAEENLRVLSAQLINLQDEERRRIALELHEGLAQDLAALRLSLGHLKRMTANEDSGEAGIINESMKLSNDLIEQVCRMSYKLHPPQLEEIGLSLAISSYARKFSERSGIEVRVLADLPEISHFPRGCEITLFRIVQECLSNIHRHSQSQVAAVCLSYQNEHLILEVADQGQGMANAAGRGIVTNPAQGIGIASMRERVNQLHGTFFMASSEGQGVTVRVVLPVADSVTTGTHAKNTFA
jgi:PAS domain S-box-containing protein